MPAMKRAWSVLVLALTAVAVPADGRERVVRLKVGPFRIEAHRDREVCQAVRIPHARGLDVVAYETRSRTAREVGTHHFIAYGYQGAASAGFPRTLVDDPGCKNGHPRFRYSCTHANGSAYEPVKMGCEAQPGVVPGISWAEGEALDVSPLETHARPCGLDGVNCAGYGTGRCVEANLVFGPLSDDDMCILPGALYDPLPGVPPEQACNPYS